ncbi:S1 family peptidase [Kitasatospora sp. DSM 101779]|uniref:S1 family peptidase n=1 Tax=Kitasatospora sp. DSM 101779 TaxID=2853165 RepID=UPI0021D93D4E|nr:S1 family peptidase [Kitasatospora sp. DSM 101779]MCU7820412.1 S1 family peptidase [Kitasatospora sp. DSM 101779]
MTALRKNTLAAVMATALVAGSILVTGINAAHAKDGDGDAPDTDSAILSLAAKTEPLNAIADALGEQGRTAYSGTYGNLFVDEDAEKVTLYVTDAQQGRKLIAAAKAAHPAIDTALIKVASAKYTMKDLDAQADRLLETSDADGLTGEPEVLSVSVNPDNSGLTVAGKKDRLDSVRTKVASGITGTAGAPVTIVEGDPAEAQSWRWNDTAPFIGGDVLVGSAHKSGTVTQCTAGMALENGVGEDYLITAAHCFRNVTDVYGEGDPEGDFSLAFGHKVGRVVNTNPYWDFQAILTSGRNGAGTNSDEADKPKGKWYRVKGASYSYNGQSVCQDGARSYYTGHGVPCGIKVQNSDIRYRFQWSDGSWHTVRGVKGHNGNWAVTRGDSGGLVFSVTNRTDRRARGLVSAGDGHTDIYWTEAPDIINALGIDLNPHT